MILKDLFVYFSDFIPTDALRGIFVASTGTAYDSFRSAVMQRTSSFRQGGLRDFIFGIDAESVQKRITQVQGMYLWVDYSTVTSSIDPKVDVKTDRLHVAVTVAVPQPTDQDQVSEVLSQDACLAVLSAIRSRMRDDTDSDNVKWMAYPSTIQPFNAKQLANSLGWTMEFDVVGVNIV